MGEEKVLFQQGDVLVTNARVQISGKTFAVANIVSVRTRAIPSPISYRGPCYLLFGGFLMLGTVLSNPADALTLVLGLVTGAAAFAMGVWWFWSIARSEPQRPTRKPWYALVIGSPSGEQEEMRSPDRELTARIAEAISSAIVARGR
jgi:hypothetical protein